MKNNRPKIKIIICLVIMTLLFRQTAHKQMHQLIIAYLSLKKNGEHNVA